MKSGLRKLLILGLGVTAAAGISELICRGLLQEALDRESPSWAKRLPQLISGSSDSAWTSEAVVKMSERLRHIPMKNVTLRASDGTVLMGHWYPAENAKRVIIAVHGWRSRWFIDFCSVTDFWHSQGCSILFVEQRAQGASGGSYLGFGLTEHNDCLEWAQLADRQLAQGLPIYLAGLSMGASTVLMTSGSPDLPASVHGIIADCGFTSPEAIWKHVSEKNLKISYPLHRRRIEALCRERLDLAPDSYSTLEAMKTNRTPILFVHGTNDHFVPFEMSVENYTACHAPKRLLLVPDAEHAQSYAVEPDRYRQAVLDFWKDFDGSAASENK